jgi:hypothetical protein
MATVAQKVKALTEEELLQKRLNRNGIITIVFLVVSFVLGLISANM